MVRRPHGPLELGVGANAHVPAFVFKWINIWQSIESYRIAESDAGRAVTIHLVGGDFAVLGRPDFHLTVSRGPAAARRNFAGAIEHQLDRRLGFASQLGGHDALDIRTEFAAKPAAHVMGDALDLIGWQGEMLGQHSSGSRDSL